MWADLPRRITTICVGVPILLVIFSQPSTSRLFFGGTHVVASYEWAQLVPAKEVDAEEVVHDEDAKTKKRDMADTNMHRHWLWLGLNVLVAQLPARFFLLGMLLCMATLYCLCGIQSPSVALSSTLHAIHGLLFVTLPFYTWKQVASQYHFTHVVTLLLIVWNCDTGALVVGRLWKAYIQMSPPPPNHHQRQQPLWLRSISPAKSVAGIVGGIVFGTATTCLLVPWMWTAVPTRLLYGDGESCDVLANDDTQWWRQEQIMDYSRASSISSSLPFFSLASRLLLGMMLSILAVTGDLLESAVKRRAMKKDAGTFLPGHGGVLDRFDSSLLAIVAYHAVCLHHRG